jgi:hypothetical protein
MLVYVMVEAIILAVTKEDHPIVLTQVEADELSSYCSQLLKFAGEVRPLLLGFRIGHKRESYQICKKPTLESVVATYTHSLDVVQHALSVKYIERLWESGRAKKHAEPPLAKPAV